jgi:hypothetical protein
MGCQALSDDASSRHVPRVSTDTNMPRAGLHSGVSHSPAECGGAPTSPGSGRPRGSLFPHVAGMVEACLPLAPCQPPSVLNCGGMGTQCVTPQDVSGGSPADPTPGIPCGRLVLDSAPDRDASSHDHRSQPPGALSPGCMCHPGNIMNDVSGGSSLSSFHELDGSLQTLPQPLSPPPSTAAIHDHGHVSALLRVSVSRVNSTVKQSRMSVPAR